MVRSSRGASTAAGRSGRGGSGAGAVCFSRQGAGHKPQLAVDRLRTHDQIAAGTTVHDVGLESLQVYLEMPRQALLDLDITHRGPQLQLQLAEIVRTAFKTNVNHSHT